jgi:nucleoside-diphosphate-sugar epimerase
MSGLSSISQKESESLAQRIDFTKIADRDILITGASGMVGSFLTCALIEGCRIQNLPLPKISVLARSVQSRNLNQFTEDLGVTIIETALSSWKIDKPYDFLIHAASPASPTQYGDTRSVIEANVGFLENIATQEVPRTTLFVSSGEVYGPNSKLEIQETDSLEHIPNGSRSVYPQAKVTAENLLRRMGEDGITKPLVARLFHSFGPGLREEDGRSFGDFLWSAAQGRDIQLLSSGEAIRTFLYLEDAVAGLLAVLTEGVSGEAYNVGSELPVTILDFATLVAEIAGVKITKSEDFDVLEGGYTHSPNSSIIPSNRKLRDLGWGHVVPLPEGINRSLEWIGRELNAKHKQ